MSQLPPEYDQASSTQPPGRPPFPLPRKRRTWLWILGVLAALGVLVGAYAYSSRSHAIGEDVYVGTYRITILGAQTATNTLTVDGGTIVSSVMTVTISVRAIDTTTGSFAAPGEWFIEANGQTYDAAYLGGGSVIFNGIPSGIKMLTLGLHCNNGSTVYCDLVFTRSSEVHLSVAMSDAAQAARRGPVVKVVSESNNKVRQVEQHGVKFGIQWADC